jgi:hypothetical protein
MAVNDEKALKKLAAARANVVVAAREGIKDAGAFMREKLTDVVLNSAGHDQTVDPSPQPPHQLSQGRYVRRRRGDLIGSVAMAIKSNQVRIYMRNSPATYSQKVLDWSRKRYGRTFMTIAVQQYGGAIKTIFARGIKEAVDAADNGTPYAYQNHYPIS